MSRLGKDGRELSLSPESESVVRCVWGVGMGDVMDEMDENLMIYTRIIKFDQHA